MLNCGMRFVSTLLAVVFLAISGQNSGEAQHSGAFSFPGNWNLVQNDAGQISKNLPLRKAIERDLGEDSFRASFVQLGSLGAGVIVNATSSNWCGATGNCEMRVYYLDHGRYHSNDLGYGWAYAVVKGPMDIPGLVVMQNMSYRSGVVRRYGFVGERFKESGCYNVELKKDGGDIRNPKQVNVSRTEPC